MQTAIAMAESELGIVVAPAYMAQWASRRCNLRSHPIEEPAVDQNVLVYIRAGHKLSTPAEKFLALLRARLQSL